MKLNSKTKLQLRLHLFPSCKEGLGRFGAHWIPRRPGRILLRLGGLSFLPPKIDCIFHFQKTQNFITKNFWDRFHVTFSDLLKFKEPRKGVLAKGFLQGPVSRPRKQKNTEGHWAAHLALRAPLPREAFLQKNLLTGKVLKGLPENGGFDAKGSIGPFLWICKPFHWVGFYRTLSGAKKGFD